MIAQGHGGAIVNVSSIASQSTFPMRTSYGAAKAGINLLTKVLAIEWARYGIRVNAVAPGMTATERGADLAKLTIGSLNEAAYTPRIPLGRRASRGRLQTLSRSWHPTMRATSAARRGLWMAAGLRGARYSLRSING